MTPDTPEPPNPPTPPTPVRSALVPPPIEPILWLLCLGILVFTVVVIACEVFWRNDGSLFTLFSNILSAFAASFFTRISGRAETRPTSSTSTTNVAVNPPVDPTHG